MIHDRKKGQEEEKEGRARKRDKKKKTCKWKEELTSRRCKLRTRTNLLMALAFLRKVASNRRKALE
jgi:hypothetical protein